MSNVIRITLFKIPVQHIPAAIQLYQTLSTTALKDGKPYILTLHAGPAHDDARNQGFNFVAKTEFKDVDDMKYYDHECAGHQDLKLGMKDLEVGGFMMVYYTPEVVRV